MIDISKDIRAMLIHFKIYFYLWDIIFIKIFLLLFMNTI